ncbi:MAG: ABC transporter permease [Saprospirales bacterium]|nr:ABC transporter permease [Saprospirales bacterium]MBK7338314.1 ABC transporter permease [Saprospirales bacterium]
MKKIFQYTLFDLIRSRWSLFYLGFFLLLTIVLLSFSGDVSKVIISLMNVVLILCPLIATMFGVMYAYNSREFTELLLAQPIRRTSIFGGQYLGLGVSQSLSLLIGIGGPFLFYGLFRSGEIWNFSILLVNGVLLTFIFSGLAFLIALRNENRIRGFGLAILSWLFFAVIYDGILLLTLVLFREYPIESLALGLSLFNPIDLSRILILLKLDISALMGYTGAVFQRFLGSGLGMSLALGMLLLWIGLPALGIRWVALRKDF